MSRAPVATRKCQPTGLLRRPCDEERDAVKEKTWRRNCECSLKVLSDMNSDVITVLFRKEKHTHA